MDGQDAGSLWVLTVAALVIFPDSYDLPGWPKSS